MIAPTPLRVASKNKLAFSAWSILRSDTSPALATGGQLGGSQAGIRARYPIGPALHVAARVSAPIGSSRGKEAAVAIDWRPIRAVPVTITVERRVGLDRAGRDAFAVGAFGGFDHTLANGARIDGYAQAGIVGTRRRDAYVDGSVRADVPVAPRIALGLGAWGGAQPGVARLDIGPQIVVRGRNLRLGAEWRARVAGDARPGSGPALSLGADF